MLTFRITGPQTVERLTPLLPLVDENISWKLFDNVDLTVVFVWETYVERAFKNLHDGALILNRLHNTIVRLSDLLSFFNFYIYAILLGT